MKTVYLHVGNFKTGTSAIQKYCSQHRSELLTLNIDYLDALRPKGNPTNHGALSVTLLHELGGHVPAWYRDSLEIESILKEAERTIKDSPHETLILSSEEFYRIPGYRPKLRHLAASRLRNIFAPYEVKVIMYVRDPFSFACSWYNEVNKSDLPQRMFCDFFYYMKDSYLLPHRNANFWRNCFGENSLVLEPYSRKGADHISRFIGILGEKNYIPREDANVPVHTMRDQATLEKDRVLKILSTCKPDERRSYLRSHVFQSTENLEALASKVRRVNRQFDEFCQREGLFDLAQPFSVSDLIVHQESVNRGDINGISWMEYANFRMQIYLRKLYNIFYLKRQRK